MSKGLFVVFEGIDRSGKSTLLKKVAERLKSQGLPVKTTHEPGGSSLGSTLRPLLLSAKNNPVTETLLFAAERSAHVAEVIKPALDEGSIVLCDRFEASTLAYQGYWRGQDLNDLRYVSQYAAASLTPDLTIWCSIDTAIAAKRRENSPDELDNQAVNASNIIAAGFKDIFSNYPESKLMIIDTSKEINDDALNSLTKRINEIYQARKGKLVVILGPSGSGKNSIVEHLLKEDDRSWYSVSATTRPPRSTEVEGVDYAFISESDFDKLIENNDLLEMAEYAGYRYGTPRSAIEEKIQAGFNVYAVLEMKGAQEVKERYPDAVTIFITPPSEEVLMRRLKNRNTEDDEAIEKRVKEASREMLLGPTVADYTICNDDFTSTIEEIKTILKY
ncbi:MAG: guanylate kinase [Candidatus Paceibacterota bacterium]